MRETKRSMMMFSYYDRTGIERWLERQAEKGWLLEKISTFAWRFRRTQPRKIHFSVNYFTKASAFDPEPSEQQLSFQDFCEYAGWKLAVSNAQMQIFYNEAEEPTPIDTDAALEIEAIHISTKKSYLPSFWMLLAVGILQAAMFMGRLLDDPLSVLASSVNLFTGLCWACILTLSLTEIMGYYRWHRKAKAAAALDGSFLSTKGNHQVKTVVLAVMYLGMVLMLFSYGNGLLGLVAVATTVSVLGVTAIVVAVSRLMKKLKVSAAGNRSITIGLTLLLSFFLTGVALVAVINGIMSLQEERVPAETYEFRGQTFHIYHDELPLTIEELIDTDYDGYSYVLDNRNKSFLVEQTECTQRSRYDGLNEADLSYTITEVKLPLLYDWCVNALLEDFDHNYGHPEPESEDWKDHREEDGGPWGAERAYQLIIGGEPQLQFLLCYEDRIVDIRFDHDWELTGEQMRIVGEKLGK